MYDYPAKLERVIDGDTVVMLVDHGMYIRSTQSIRLLQVNAPEMNEVGGVEFRELVMGWMEMHALNPLTKEPREWPFMLYTKKNSRSFNRYLGEISCRLCGESLNLYLRELLEP